MSGEAAGTRPLQAQRYERKFRIDTLTPHQVAAVVRLHPRMFYEPYLPRFVNNLYLDTADLEHYFDTVHGAAERRKVRVRWYGELWGEVQRPALEIKIREGYVGTKRAYPLPGFCLDGRFGDGAWLRLAEDGDLPPAVRCELLCLRPVLLNRYYRRYYASRDGAFRVTLDLDVTYYRANGGLRNGFVHRQTNAREVIVELKYGAELDGQAERVASGFPFRMTRHSKYVQGVERVYF